VRLAGGGVVWAKLGWAGGLFRRAEKEKERELGRWAAARLKEKRRERENGRGSLRGFLGLFELLNFLKTR
jgi:hypothetical protein